MSERKSFFEDLGDRHERLKKRIHNFRIPLGPFGRFVMSCVYFSIPMVGGYYLMEAVKNRANENLKDLSKQSKSIINYDTKKQNEALKQILDEASSKSN